LLVAAVTAALRAVQLIKEVAVAVAVEWLLNMSLD
jgi:hypothetical protein